MLKTVKTTYIGPFIETAVLILMAMGTVCVFSAGANVGIDYDLQHFYDFTTLKQIFFFPLAVVIMYLASRIDYERFSFRGALSTKSFTPYLLILAIALLVLVLIPGVGVERHGVHRWLDLAPGPVYVSFQPSELAKWALVFFLAAFVDKFAGTIKLYWRRFVPICLVAGVVVGLIVTRRLWHSGIYNTADIPDAGDWAPRWWHFLTGLPVVLPAFYFAIVVSPTRVNRIKTFIDPNVISYQARQSLIAISSGGIWGKGLGKGICKYGHLPEDTTDFIFSIIAEELGFVGAAFVIALFIAFVLLGITIVIRCDDRFGRLLAGGIVLTIAIQAAINIGVATVVLPTKGISLPFISAGGTGMLLSAGAVGLLLNIAKRVDTRRARGAASAGDVEQTREIKR